MVESLHCPMCPDGELSRGEGRLDQSGETYLPTVVWGCTTCGYARYEPAVGASWRGRWAHVEQASEPLPLAEPLAA